MSAQPTPMWGTKKRRFSRPHLPHIKLDGQDKQALRKVGVYTVATCMACMAITFVIVVVCLWIRLAMLIV